MQGWLKRSSTEQAVAKLNVILLHTVSKIVYIHNATRAEKHKPIVSWIKQMLPLLMRGILNGGKRHNTDQCCAVSPPQGEETFVDITAPQKPYRTTKRVSPHT